jgi:thiol-disulfide isomerase/thioredoxin
MLVIAAVVVSAVGLAGAATAPGMGAESAQAGAAPVRASGPPAPDFTVPTLDGGTFTLSAHRGKPVVIFTMAYWCLPCVLEAQALAKLHQRYGDTQF